MPTANAKNDLSLPGLSGQSRGYTKISAAAKALGVDFRGKTVLDIGSSTGGFTEYALERGAAKVIAVEKGSHQMRAPLRFDPRIELHEKTDIFNYKPTGSDPVGIVLADVSFISLTKILKHTKTFASEFLVMLKPQFEAKSSQLIKGIVKNEAIRRDIIKNFEAWLRANHFVVIGKRDNALSGRHGNTERFYRLSTH